LIKFNNNLTKISNFKIKLLINNKILISYKKLVNKIKIFCINKKIIYNKVKIKRIINKIKINKTIFMKIWIIINFKKMKMKKKNKLTISNKK
jgi:hypothetical protein